MKKRHFAAAWAVSLCLLLTSCGNAAPESSSFQVQLHYASDEAYHEAVMASQSYEAASNERYRLVVHPDSAAVTVTDKQTGAVYETNPDAMQAESREIASNRSVARSQLVLSFLDSTNSNQQNSWNSYDQCIAKKQYSFYPVENGIGVNYFFGEMPEDILVPEILSVASYEKLASQMDEANKAMLDIYYTKVSLDMYSGDDSVQAAMKQKYPILSKQAVYILQMSVNISFEKLSKDQLRMVEPVLQAGGYTREQYQQDVQLSGDGADYLKQLQFSVALEYTLSEDGFCVTVPADSISYDSTVMTVTGLAVLPDFEAVSADEEAQMFVPDGCGALIYANNGVNQDMDYCQRVYGEDELLMTGLEEDPQSSEICLPVFGMLRPSRAFLAVITQGDGYAYIHAAVSGDSTNYNRVYASFKPRAYMAQSSNALGDQENYISAKTELSHPITVQYTLLGAGSDYKTLAGAYREYLTQNGLLAQSRGGADADVFIIQSVLMQKSVLGIPVTTNAATTDFAQTAAIIDDITGQEAYAVDTVLLSWCNDGNNNRLLLSVDPLSALGSKKQLSALLQKGSVYEGLNFFSAQKSATAKRYSARDMDGLPVSVYDFFKQAKQDNYIVSPAGYTTIAQRFLKANESYGRALCDLYAAKRLAADYAEEAPVDRQDAIGKTRELLGLLADGSDTLKLCGANAYALAYADSLSDVPLRSSGKYIFNEDVPFLQMVLSGAVPYSGEALNLSDNYRESLLCCIELGAVPHFELMEAENTRLVNSLEDRYSVNYAMWSQELKEACAIARQCRQAIGGARMTDHTSDGTLTCTTYENGVKVYVNYADTAAATPEGEAVSPRGYRIVTP